MTLDVSKILTVATLVAMILAGARAYQSAEDENRVLRHRVEVLERITISEHPAYTLTIDWSTYR